MEQYLGPLTFIAIIVFSIVSLMIGWWAGRNHERDIQHEKYKMMGWELEGVLVDVKHGTGFDKVCESTLYRVRNALLTK
jgi:hypothetical protein